MDKLRVVLITQGLSFLPLQLEEEEVVGMCESAPRGWRASVRSQFLRRLRDGAKRLLGRPTLSGYARRRRVPYFWLHRDNEPAFVEWMRQLKPDVLLTYSMSQLLGSAVLDVPPLGALNVHPSLLPDYRGPNPWFWVYRDGVLRSGVTIHQLDNGEDTGPIAAQAHFDVPLGQSLEMSMETCQETVIDLLREVLARLKLGELVLRPQERSSGTVRAKNPTAQDIQNLSRWTEWESVRAYHFLRGMVNQYPELLMGMREQPALHYDVTGYFLNATSEASGRCSGQSLVCGDGRVYYMESKVPERRLQALLRRWR
jgi:methionyl-tRNA formyltransferase